MKIPESLIITIFAIVFENWTIVFGGSVTPAEYNHN